MSCITQHDSETVFLAYDSEFSHFLYRCCICLSYIKVTLGSWCRLMSCSALIGLKTHHLCGRTFSGAVEWFYLCDVISSFHGLSMGLKSRRIFPVLQEIESSWKEIRSLQLPKCILHFFSINLFFFYWTDSIDSWTIQCFYSVQRLDLFAWCVRLSWLLNPVSNALKIDALSFHFISYDVCFVHYCSYLQVFICYNCWMYIFKPCLWRQTCYNSAVLGLF